VARENAAKLVAFHQPGYVDRFTDVLTRNEEKRKQIHDGLPVGWSKSTAFHYTTRTADSLQALCNDVGSLLSDLEQDCMLLNNDIGVLKKYVPIFTQTKLNRCF
jgi:hypothetical protein